jgi:phospholipase/carboxylesterase
MAILLDGPRLAPASGGAPDSLVVLLHGYGSNGQDLIGLAPYWRKILPNTQFVAPNAPEPVPGAPGGFQWWDLAVRRDPESIKRGAQAAAPGVDRFLDRELERYKLPPDRLALVGFSQGTMMSLHVGVRRATAPAAILGYSGMLVAPDLLKAEAKCAPAIFLVHGDQDELLPVSAMFDAAEALAEAGLGAQWKVCQNLGHSIDPDGMEAGGEFLAKAFKRSPIL